MVVVRLTEAGYRRIEARAASAGMTVSEVIRQMLKVADHSMGPVRDPIESPIR